MANKTHMALVKKLVLAQEVKDGVYKVEKIPYGAMLVYHRTPVATIDFATGRLTLRNNGYKTATTKALINAVLEGLRLDRKVVQQNFTWTIQDSRGTISEFTDPTVINLSDDSVFLK